MPETEVQDTIYYLERLLSELRRYEWGYKTNAIVLKDEAHRMARSAGQDVFMLISNGEEDA